MILMGEKGPGLVDVGKRAKAKNVPYSFYYLNKAIFTIC